MGLRFTRLSVCAGMNNAPNQMPNGVSPASTEIARAKGRTKWSTNCRTKLSLARTNCRQKSFSFERIPVRRPTVHKRDVKYFVVQAHIFCRTDFNFCRNDFCFCRTDQTGFCRTDGLGDFGGFVVPAQIFCRTGSDILSDGLPDRLLCRIGRQGREEA